LDKALGGGACDAMADGWRNMSGVGTLKKKECKESHAARRHHGSRVVVQQRHRTEYGGNGRVRVGGSIEGRGE